MNYCKLSLPIAAFVGSLLTASPALSANQSAGNLIEAETFDAMQGVVNGGTDVGSVDGAEGDWIMYAQTDFGTGISGFSAWVAVTAEYAGRNLEIRLDSPGGMTIGTLTVQSTGGWNTFVQQSTPVQTVTGIHDLYLVPAAGAWGVANIDKFQFTSTSSTPPTSAKQPSAPLSFSGTDSVVIQNRIIDGSNTSANCITVSGATTSVLIDNVELHHCALDGISVSNSSNVVIQNSQIHDLVREPAQPNFYRSQGIRAVNVTNFTVTNSQFHDIYTNTTQPFDEPAVAMHLEQVRGAAIFRNTFQNVGSGVYAVEGSTGINVHHNSGLNWKGPLPRGQMVQFAFVSGAGNSIECNISDNVRGANNTEDNINLYASSGTAASPILVRYNRTRNGSSSMTGSGIVVESGPSPTSYVHVIGNRIVTPNNAGIGITDASNILVRENKLFATDATISHEGLYGHGACSNLQVDTNRLNWPKDLSLSPGYGQPLSFRSTCSATDSDGTVFYTDSEGNNPPTSNVTDDTAITADIWNEPIAQCQ
jgi:hypothetical protein